MSLVCQNTLPVFLSSAATRPLGPPGVMINLSPSTRGDQAKPQPVFSGPPPIPLTSADNSLGKSLRQTSSPLSFLTQTRIPWLPRANTRSPSTLGVALGP